jgi:hypothetical protein
MRGDLGGLRRKAFLIGLGLGGLLELLFHWLEGGSEHGGGQLGNVPAISDSGFNPFLDQPLLQFDVPLGFSLRPAPASQRSGSWHSWSPIPDTP